MRQLSFKPARAAILSSAILSCSAHSENSLPPVVIDIPATSASVPSCPHAQSSPHAPPSPSSSIRRTDESESLIPTRMTILLSGDSMFAYVSAPSEGTWKDLEGANSSFFYETSKGWTPVPGCQSVFECDVSSVRIGNTRFKAIFTPASGIFAGAEGTFP